MSTFEPRTVWFLGGIILLALLLTSAPKIGAPIAILVVIFLAIELADKGIL